MGSLPASIPVIAFTCTSVLATFMAACVITWVILSVLAILCLKLCLVWQFDLHIFWPSVPSLPYKYQPIFESTLLKLLYLSLPRWDCLNLPSLDFFLLLLIPCGVICFNKDNTTDVWYVRLFHVWCFREYDAMPLHRMVCYIYPWCLHMMMATRIFT